MPRSQWRRIRGWAQGPHSFDRRNRIVRAVCLPFPTRVQARQTRFHLDLRPDGALFLTDDQSTPSSLNMDEANQRLESMSAQERIAWGVERFGMGAVLLSSMQKTSSVLMHMFSVMGLDNEILFVDTATTFTRPCRPRRLHSATQAQHRHLYPKNTPERQEQLYGVKLYQFSDGQKQCCDMRKEQPSSTR